MNRELSLSNWRLITSTSSGSDESLECGQEKVCFCGNASTRRTQKKTVPKERFVVEGEYFLMTESKASSDGESN